MREENPSLRQYQGDQQHAAMREGQGPFHAIHTQPHHEGGKSPLMKKSQARILRTHSARTALNSNKQRFALFLFVIICLGTNNIFLFPVVFYIQRQAFNKTLQVRNKRQQRKQHIVGVRTSAKPDPETLWVLR